MSKQAALALNVTREAFVVQDARGRDPHPRRVASFRGILDGLAGEAKARDDDVFVNVADANETDPELTDATPGGPFPSVGVIVYPDETAELGIESPEHLRGLYRLNLDDAAVVLASIETGE